MARESLVDTLIVVTDESGNEIECDMDVCFGHMDEELSQSLTIGRAVRNAIMDMEHDGAVVKVRIYSK